MEDLKIEYWIDWIENFNLYDIESLKKQEVLIMKYHGKITFTIGKNHPDIEYVPDWREGKFYTVEDEYTFNEEYTEENATAYIKNDLMLVAGGGYNTDHIHNVMFEIEKV